MQITRKKLVKFAFKVIEKHKDDVSEENRDHLLYAACTAKKIALGSWVISPDCGCLVGTAYLNAGGRNTRWTPEHDGILTSSDDEREALMKLGEKFDELLLAYVSERPDAAHLGQVQVID